MSKLDTNFNNEIQQFDLTKNNLMNSYQQNFFLNIKVFS
jgi:hypothetical protein